MTGEGHDGAELGVVLVFGFSITVGSKGRFVWHFAELLEMRRQ
jgi:hypothetical protein